MKSRLSSQQGVALIAALAFLVITMALIGTAMLVSLSDIRLSTSNTRTIQAQFAAEAAIDETVLTLWHGITEDIRADKADEPNYSNIAVGDYRERWDDLGIKPALDDDDDDSEVVYGKWGEVWSQDGTLNLEGDEDATYVVDVWRKDIDYDESELRLVATVTLPGGSQRKLEQVYSITLPPFELDFALLSDVVNCTFCHSAFISIEAGYDSTVTDSNSQGLVDITNKDARIAAAEGTQRIRVAALSDFRISTGFSRLHTLVGGTIYTRGLQNIMHNGGCSGDRFGNKCGVYGPVYDKNDDGEYTGMIANADYEQFRKNTTTTPTTGDQLLTCTSSDNDGNAGCDQENARFYENYPTEEEGEPLPVDGTIPNVALFPSPIRDLDDNRVIDSDEWETVVKDALPGSITDAAIIRVSETDSSGVPVSSGSSSFSVTFDGTINLTPVGPQPGPPISVTDPTLSIGGLENSIDYDNERGVPGNLILIGSDTNPIDIDGTVYVDGDVIIQGFVSPGSGSDGDEGVIIARGNVYIIGDVVYDCNGSASGGGCNYVDPASLPRFALVAGGVMVVGDPGEARSGNFPLQGEILAFNDRQFQKRDDGIIATARYYIWREGDAPLNGGVWRCTVTECRDWNTPSSNRTTVNTSGQAIVSVSPTNSWLTSPVGGVGPDDTYLYENVVSEFQAIYSEVFISALWQQYGLNNNRDDNNGERRALRIDGLLYTNGAILGYLRSTDSMHGSLTINGSIIAYETGLLIYGMGWADSTGTCDYNKSDTSNSLFERDMPECVGLRVQYDKRLPSLIDLREDEPALFRTSYQWLSIEEAE